MDAVSDAMNRVSTFILVLIKNPLIPYMGQRRGIAHGHTKKAAKRVA